MRLVFDIETDGLPDTLTKIHCIHAADVDTGEFFDFGPKDIPEGIRFLEQADELIAHNGFGFDFHVITMLYPWFSPKGTLRDTLAEARLIHANVLDVDFTRKRKGLLGTLPPHMMGTHGLEAWGHRLGLHKGDYAKEMKAKGLDPWAQWNQEMHDYCHQDVVVTLKLVKNLESKQYSQPAIFLENRIAALMSMQERNGFVFNERSAADLYARLSVRRAEIQKELIEAFGWWIQPLEAKLPTRSVCYKEATRADQTEGAPFTTFIPVTFNPSSRQHIAKRLTALYGWKPTEFTDNGAPKIDETVLSRLDNPHARLLAESFIVEKRIGQLAEGPGGWLRKCRNGKIHGRVNPNGAVTGRATHSSPNLAQVPSTGAPYGAECRALFTVPTGWYLLGSDASGLELRCLGHFMAAYDGGSYIKILLEGDVHWANVLALGLVPAGTARDKHDASHEAARAMAKTFIYAFLYGAGDEKIGSIVLPNASPEAQKKEGRKLKKRFLTAFPALKEVITAVKASANEPTDPTQKSSAPRRRIEGLDGRWVAVRSDHAALNTLLQSAGALVCKRWLIELEDLCTANGLMHGWKGDFAFCAWVHDEVQIACRTKETTELIGSLSKQAMSLTEQYFNFLCPLDADFGIGKTWADTH
jgi:DNA polymerase-1